MLVGCAQLRLFSCILLRYLEDIQEDISDMFVCYLLQKTKQHNIICPPVDEAD